MDTLLQDLRCGMRALRKQPGFSAIAVLTLAVGIGANTAIFSVVNAALLRPFPFREPDRLMKVSLVIPSMHGEPPRDDVVWSYPKFQTFRQLQQVFERLATYRGGTFNLTGIEEPERVSGEIVGADYFPVLGVGARVGRTFLPEEDATPGTHWVALLGHGLWQRRFGGDPAVVGTTITLDTRTYTVVGVLPPGFRGLSALAEVWMPTMTLGAEDLAERWNHSHDVIARLRPGVTAAQAKSAVEVLGKQVDEAHPNRAPSVPWGARARTLAEARIDPAIRRSVLVLFGAVGFVLLIACVNVANLQLARSSAREREIAIRLAVGASRGRLVRQLLTESVLLAALGALAGAALAAWGVHVLTSINPAAANPFGRRFSGYSLIALGSVRLDGAALLFTAATALATGILFGLAPALAASRAELTDALKSGGLQAAGPGGARGFSGRSFLAAAEISLALVLLVGSGLMIKSFGRLLATRSGVDPENLLTSRVNLPAGQYGREASIEFFSQLETRAAALPGVVSAGMSNCPPLAGGCNGTLIWFRDRPEVSRGAEPSVGVHWVSPSYFRTMGIPLLRGRGFGPADRLGAPKVVLVNETAARRFWPNEDPIGKPIGVGQGGFGDRAEIVGVVGDVRYGTLEEVPNPDVYICHQQSARNSLILYVRGRTDPAA
ncbi:MAG: hypothetical protein DMG07_21690, partial [Acidobacteria bacterium]